MSFSKKGFEETKKTAVSWIHAVLVLLFLACQKDPAVLKSPARSQPQSYIPRSFLQKGIVQSPWGIQEIWFRDFSKTHVVAEGDMLISKASLLGSQENKGLGAFGVMIQDRLWPDGLIYYDYEADLDSRIVTAFEAGVKEWNEKTRFEWLKKDPESSGYHVLIKRWHKGGGLSSVGRSPESGKNYQEVLLDLNCLSRCLKHEMGHVMGLWHEHSRPDRDEYIEVHFDNIAPGDQGNFSTLNLTQSQILSEFDMDSIMLYGSEYLSKDSSLRSMSRRDGGLIIASEGISSQDIAGLNRIWQQWFDLQELKKIYLTVYGTDVISQSDYKSLQDKLNAGTSLRDLKLSLLDRAEIKEAVRLTYEKILGSVPEDQSPLSDYLLDGGDKAKMAEFLLGSNYFAEAVIRVHLDLYGVTVVQDSPEFSALREKVVAGSSLSTVRGMLAESSEIREMLTKLFLEQLKRDAGLAEISIMTDHLKEGGGISGLKEDLPGVMIDSVYFWFYHQDPSSDTREGLIGLLKSGTTLEKIREDILTSHDFGTFIRKTVFEILNTEATEEEFSRFKSLSESKSFREAVKTFVLTHTGLNGVLVENAREIWGISPSEVQVSAWKQELALGASMTSVISSMLETEEAVDSIKTHLKNLLGKDLQDPQVSEWKNLFWDDWKSFLKEADGLKLWRDKIIDSEPMQKELEARFSGFFDRKGEAGDYIHWKEQMRKNQEFTLKNLESMMADSPEVSVKIIQMFNKTREKDPDFSDLEEWKGRLKSLGDWKKLRKEMK